MMPRTRIAGPTKVEGLLGIHVTPRMWTARPDLADPQAAAEPHTDWPLNDQQRSSRMVGLYVQAAPEHSRQARAPRAEPVHKLWGIHRACPSSTCRLASEAQNRAALKSVGDLWPRKTKSADMPAAALWPVEMRRKEWTGQDEEDPGPLRYKAPLSLS